ncbi:MAG TPA: hypothetical protein VNT42_10480 [Sphingomonas sp.]|nr:hypothetical protein [Sphingomonas sp.]
MPVSSETLNHPIDPAAPELQLLLDDLQGNILKGHGRDHTTNIFLRFDPAKRASVKDEIRRIGGFVLSASQQFEQNARFKLLNEPGGTVVFFFLSSKGYAALGIAGPPDPKFQAGLEASRAILADPARDQWEAQFRGEVHAMLLVASDSLTQMGNFGARMTQGFEAAGIHILGRDAGHALRRSMNDPQSKKNPGIEHFGYVDGRSQPLFLTTDVQGEDDRGGIDKWDPSAGPGELVLVRDPHGQFEDSYGSYFVYRKLEQNVRAFKAREGEEADEQDGLAEALGLQGEDRERAGALVVGRFEIGSPVTVADEADEDSPDPAINNFNYDDDPGSRCPLHAHIRVTNPRERHNRAFLMARRGIPYGERSVRDIEEETIAPEGGVGLLFMAYNKVIAQQFEATQIAANKAARFDGVLGSAHAPHTPQQWPTEYNDPTAATKAFDFGGFVEMKGGEYFFAPSRSFLRTLS